MTTPFQRESAAAALVGWHAYHGRWARAKHWHEVQRRQRIFDSSDFQSLQPDAGAHAVEEAVCGLLAKISMGGELLAAPAIPDGAVAVEVIVRDGLGGNIDAALVLLDGVKQRFHPSLATIEARGQCASAHALVVVCWSGRRRMHAEGSLLLHAPTLPVVGDRARLMREAERLATTEREMVRGVAARSGRPVGEVARLFRSGTDTVVPAPRALELHLVDEVISAKSPS